MDEEFIYIKHDTRIYFIIIVIILLVIGYQQYQILCYQKELADAYIVMAEFVLDDYYYYHGGLELYPGEITEI